MLSLEKQTATRLNSQVAAVVWCSTNRNLSSLFYILKAIDFGVPSKFLRTIHLHTPCFFRENRRAKWIYNAFKRRFPVCSVGPAFQSITLGHRYIKPL